MIRSFQMSASPARRRGVAATEFAMVLPLIVFMLLGGMEIGRAVSVQQTLTETSRGACRLYAVNSKTQTEVNSYVDECMENANISNYTVTFSPTNEADVDEQLEEVSVTVSVPHEDVAWTMFRFMGGRTISSTTVMPADIRDYSTIEPENSTVADEVADNVEPEPRDDGVNRNSDPAWDTYWQNQYSTKPGTWYSSGDDDDDDDDDDD